MKRQFTLFVIRWVVNAFALWIAVRILSSGDYATSRAGFSMFLLAGIALSIVNVLLRPFIVVLSLPAILLTLGLFMLVVNVILVYIVFKLIPQIEITFVGAIAAGVVVSLANYVLSGIIERYRHTKEQYL